MFCILGNPGLTEMKIKYLFIWKDLEALDLSGTSVKFTVSIINYFFVTHYVGARLNFESIHAVQQTTPRICGLGPSACKIFAKRHHTPFVILRLCFQSH